MLRYAPELADKNYASGLIAYASIFKALALTNMAMFWEQVPDTIGVNVNTGFVSNTVALNKALDVVNNALSTVSANAIAPSFLFSIPAGVDIVNTLQALKARLCALYRQLCTGVGRSQRSGSYKKINFEFRSPGAEPYLRNGCFNEQRISTGGFYYGAAGSVGT